MRDPGNEVEESHVSQTNRVFLKRGLQPHRGSCFHYCGIATHTHVHTTSLDHAGLQKLVITVIKPTKNNN